MVFGNLSATTAPTPVYIYGTHININTASCAVYVARCWQSSSIRIWHNL